MDEARSQMAGLAEPAVSLAPGRYRVYLAPAAMQGILDTLAWGGFGLKSHKTRQTALIKMREGGVRLDPSVTIREDHAGGLAPAFTPSGFMKPDCVTLVDCGALGECLVGPRSSAEYGQPVNAAGEFPESLAMDGGGIRETDLLKELDSGLYISNLWYLNYSDRNDCRITGMTRFACFQVEGGKIRAPINVMRFDESIYSLLGDNLVGLTEEREFTLDSGTYEQRSTGSACVPGALIADFALTL